MFLCELQSAEDVDRLLRSYPGTQYIYHEVYAISDMKETARANAEVARATRARMAQS